MQQAQELRVALTVDDLDGSVSFYRDVVGLAVREEWPSANGRGVLFSLPEATLEIIDQEHSAWVDEVQVERRVSGPVRLAIRFPDLEAAVATGRRSPAALQMKRPQPREFFTIPCLPMKTPWRNSW